MKKLILPFLLVISPFAMATTSHEIEATLEDLELKSYIQTTSGSKEYVWKSSTTCSTKGSGKDVLYPGLKAVSYYVCPDKTISHIQPDSTGYNGWEGYCGQTAVSNVTSMLCNRHMSPKSNDYYGTDASPGQHSSTMKKSLRKIFTESPARNTCPKVTWNTRASWSGSGFLKSVKGDLFGSTKKVRRYRTATTYVEVTPTPVLLNSGGFNYHWVTVVDIIKNKNDDHGCDVVVNTWGDQKTLTCTNFVNYGDHSGLGEHVSLGFDK